MHHAVQSQQFRTPSPLYQLIHSYGKQVTIFISLSLLPEMGSEILHFTYWRITVSFSHRKVSCLATISWKAHAHHQQSLFPFIKCSGIADKCSVAKCTIGWLDLAHCAWRYKPQCRPALLRQNDLYPLCCLSAMLIIDKKSIAWLTKDVWLLPHISEPKDYYFLIAPRVLLELDHDSWSIMPLSVSVWKSLSCALKDQQGFDARLAISEYGQLPIHCLLSWTPLSA